MTITEYSVSDTYYYVHVKRDASESAPRSMRVDYKIGWHLYKSEWVCFEHRGFARQKAVAWWRQRSPDPVPETAERAVELANAGAVAATHKIKVRAIAGEQYERIIDHELGPMPEPLPVDVSEVFEEVPF